MVQLGHKAYILFQSTQGVLVPETTLQIPPWLADILQEPRIYIFCSATSVPTRCPYVAQAGLGLLILCLQSLSAGLQMGTPRPQHSPPPIPLPDAPAAAFLTPVQQLPALQPWLPGCLLLRVLLSKDPLHALRDRTPIPW